jgi:signal transduction histidine kinase
VIGPKPPSSERTPAFADERTPGEQETGLPQLGRGTRDQLADAATAASGLREDLSTIVHDLKNPLGVILLEAQALGQRLGRAAPSVHHSLERITMNAMYVERLASWLLDLAASEEGKLDLRLERVDLAVLVRSTVERAVASFDRPRVVVDVRRPLSVRGDAMRLERVVANLLDNALKHGPRDLQVTVRLDERDNDACVSVIDHGPGLAPDEVAACFERYRRGARSEGHGLGLYISRKIIEAHRGRIGVQTTCGKGARFYFVLPLN